jgi:signal transduction histidine kinase
METLLCPWEPSTYLFFSTNVPALVHYSHFISILAALAVAVFVFISNPRTAVSRLFLALVSTFSLWTILDLMLWATNRPDIVMLAWSLQILLEPLTYAAAFYLYFHFVHGRWPSFGVNLAISILFLPILLLLHTNYNLGELYLSACELAEGPIAKYYTHFVHATFILAIILTAVSGVPRIVDKPMRKTALFFVFGLLSFLIAFSSGTLIGSLTDDWVPSQYGLFGMPIFASFIAYCIIRFRAFDAKVITAEVLVVSLGVAVVSLIALQDIQNVRIVAGITFVLVCIVGLILVRNVRREIEQRKLIEIQEKELERVNKQQEGLLAFISHEVKGYLAKSQAAFAGIIQNDYGAITPQLHTMAETGLADMRKGVDMVADILDASNLRKGTVAYDKKPFDLKASIEEAVRDLLPAAAKKGVTLDFAVSSGDYTITGDEAKIRRHVIRNLVDNSIHYTMQGNIHVSLSRNAQTIHFSVKDTGVGITVDDMKNLFTEGGHGKESMKVNADSTGYGLFIAKQVTEAHNGKIWAQSKGKGQGSEFIVELPV